MFYQKEDLEDELQDVTSLKNKFNDHFNHKLPNPTPPTKEKPKIPEKPRPRDVKTRNAINDQLSKSKSSDVPLVDSEIKETYSNLVNRIKDKIKSKNFTFTMMIVGESGLGKSTLINQLFNCEIYDQNNPGPSFKPCKTTRIDINKIHLVENQVNLYLNLVDTPGFGVHLDNTNCCVEIMDFIEKKFDEYLIEETKFGQAHNRDYRVHCCLYFIQPTGHSLKQLDIEFMKKLCNKVNLVPIIAKADTLTQDELHQFKKHILEDIKKNEIDIYDFPDYQDLNFEKDEITERDFYRSLVPFAIISSNQVEVDTNGIRKRVRKYPWGSIDIENLEYSDFIAMKKLIIKYHLLDMIERTNIVHYEKYRLTKLDSIEDLSTKPKRNPLSQMEEEKKEYEERMVKMRQDMEEVFNSKVSKKVKRLDEIKSELKKRETEMDEQLIEMNANLKQKREQFEKEKEAFEFVKKEMDVLIIANQENIKENEPKKKEKKKGLF